MRFSVLAFVAFVALFALGQTGSVSLTKANFDSQMAGKAAFIKFQAPW